MKKAIEKLNNRNKYFAFGALALIAVALIASGAWVAVGGISLAMALPVLTDEDKVLVEHMKQEMGKALEKFEKGYVSETKCQELMEAAIEDALKGGVTAEEIIKINASLDEQGAALQAMKERSVAIEAKNIKEAFKEAFATEGLTEKIKKVFQAGAGVVDVMKAVANITTSNVSTDTGGNAILDLLNADELEGLRLRDQFIENYCTVTRTSKPVYTYADYVPKEGDVDYVLEAGTKPQLDLNLEVRTETPRKAAGHAVLSEEAIDDIPRMESEARMLIFKKYILRRQNGILFGDGLSANPLGITNIAGAFNSATWTGDKKATPNLYDAIIAAKNQIEIAANYTDDVDYYPNVVFLNPADYNALLIKQDDKVYTFNQIQGKEPVNIAGIDIVSKKEIPAGKMLIGDFTMLHVVNYIDYNLKIGYVNDQLIKNLFTMVGEGRFYVFVKHYDQLAFIYDDISNIIDGITEEVG